MTAHPDVLRAHEVGQRDPEEGLAILDDLLANEPDAAGAYNVYGQLAMKLGDLTTARDAFERDIRANPDGDLRFDWAYLALIVGLQDDIPLAKRHAEKAGTIRLDAAFAGRVRDAYIGWRRKRGKTPSRLGSPDRSDGADSPRPVTFEVEQESLMSSLMEYRLFLWSPVPIVLGAIITGIGYLNVAAGLRLVDPGVREAMAAAGHAQARIPLFAGLLVGLIMAGVAIGGELTRRK